MLWVSVSFLWKSFISFLSNQNLAMFGIDIIVEKGTGHHVVIDINYFPGKFHISS